MKQSVRSLLLMALALILGGAGAGLRSFYFKNSVDAGGFLLRMTPAQILFWILALVMIALSLLLSGKSGREGRKPPMGIPAGLGQIFLGLGLAVTAFRLDKSMNFYGVLRILCLGTAALLTADGIFRLLHRSLGVYPNGILCAFLILFAIGSYSGWRGVPEMERILVPAIAQLLLLPLSCEMAFLDHSGASDRRLLLFGSLTCFFSVAALGCPGAIPLHLGGALWSLMLLWNLREEGER